MRNTALRSPIETDLTLEVLQRQIQNWLLDGEYRLLSKATLEGRQNACVKLLWFLRHKEMMCCGTAELRAFLAYLNTAHERGGRWETGRTDPMSSESVRTYYGNLQTLFRFIVEEGTLTEDPMARLKPPISRPDQVEPFTTEQVKALLTAAGKSRHPKRDDALVRFFFDTGCRSSEVCGLALEKLDLHARSARVLGKGNKERTVSYGKRAGRALWAYLREEEREPDAPVFLAEGGHGQGGGLTRFGMYQLIQRLAQNAGIQRNRIGPHTLRHTFAVQFLRDGGSEFSLMHILGHNSLHQTRKYVNFVNADISNQQRLHSPGDRLRE